MFGTREALALDVCRWATRYAGSRKYDALFYKWRSSGYQGSTKEHSIDTPAAITMHTYKTETKCMNSSDPCSLCLTPADPKRDFPTLIKSRLTVNSRQYKNPIYTFPPHSEFPSIIIPPHSSTVTTLASQEASQTPAVFTNMQRNGVHVTEKKPRLIRKKPALTK